MPLFSFEGRSPKVDPTAFVAPTATLIGDVTIEAGASVWFNTVLRADYAPVIVREGAHVPHPRGPRGSRGADRQPRHRPRRRRDRLAQLDRGGRSGHRWHQDSG